jgi:phosphatidylglycerol lysyltransferase
MLRLVKVDLTLRRRVLELLRRFGWNTTSFQVLEPDFRYWFDGDDACVAYVDTGGAWVAAGGPLATEERLGELAKGFVAEARRRGRRAVFFAVEKRLLHAYPMQSLQVGEQPTWRPGEWEASHRGHRSFREQLRRARKKGVVVSREEVDRMKLEGSRERAELRSLIDSWLATRRMPPMAFLVELDPFVFSEERRYYLARVNGEVRGALVAVPVYLRNGWFFEDILRHPSAPNGTVELMIDTAMRDVAADGAGLVTLGLAPLGGEARWLRFTRMAMRPFYNFDGLRAFKAKFRPQTWDRIFVAWPEGGSVVLALYDVLSAFARGRPFAFGIAAVVRNPAPALALLATLLVPWTMALASAAAIPWFPSRVVQWSWVVFDVVAAATFFALAQRWRRRLAWFVLAATVVDVALTSVQAVAFNIPRATKWWEGALVAVAIAAPAVAAALVWRSIRARR